MKREPRSTIVKKENKIAINLDDQTTFEVDMIIFLLMEISKTHLTEKEAKQFIDCLRDKYLHTVADVAGFEDMVGDTYDLLNSFVGKVMRKGSANE